MTTVSDREPPRRHADLAFTDVRLGSLSRYHKENPYKIEVGGEEFGVDYWPGDSHSAMFGGNSNWRGPIWLATTQLLIESLQRFYQVRRIACSFVSSPDSRCP